MEVSRDEMLELAKVATFNLDDRLVPWDRETLRAEAWLAGYEFACRHKPERKRGLYDQFMDECRWLRTGGVKRSAVVRLKDRLYRLEEVQPEDLTVDDEVHEPAGDVEWPKPEKSETGMT